MNKLATRTTGIFVAMTAVLILAFAMVMTVSAQSDDPDWRLPVTGLTVSAGDDPGELVINGMLIPKLRKHYETTVLPGHQKVRVSSVPVKPIGTSTRPAHSTR